MRLVRRNGSALRVLGLLQVWIHTEPTSAGIDAVHIIEERGGAITTKGPRKRAAEISRFREGDAMVLCAGIKSVNVTAKGGRQARANARVVEFHTPACTPVAIATDGGMPMVLPASATPSDRC